MTNCTEVDTSFDEDECTIQPNATQSSGYAPPWLPPKRGGYANTLEGLQQEINDFVAWVSPTKEERDMRKDILSRMREVVHSLWPDAKIETVGSYKTDLCVPTSDIDFVIFGAHAKFEGSDIYDLAPLFALAAKLEELQLVRGEVQVVCAKVVFMQN